MSKEDILNELASMGLEAEYRNSISVMLDGFERSIREDCKRNMIPNGVEDISIKDMIKFGCKRREE